MTKKIAIVEDDQRNLTLFTDLLVYAGYDVVGIKDGTSAISKIQSVDPDLIIMDLLLNDGVSGSELIAILKSDAEFKTPIIGTTSQKNDEADSFYENCEKALPKPVSINKTLDAVRELIGA